MSSSGADANMFFTLITYMVLGVEYQLNIYIYYSIYSERVCETLTQL